MEFPGRKSFWTFPDDAAAHQGFRSAPISPNHPSSPSTPWQLIAPPRRSLGNPPLPLHPSPPADPSFLYNCLTSVHFQDGNVHAIALARIGRLVFTCSDSDRVGIWSQSNLAVRGLLRTRRQCVRILLAHSDKLFTAHGDRRVRIWTFAASSISSSPVVRWRKLATIPPRRLRISLFRRWQDRSQLEHREEISCLALYTAGGLLYTGSWDRTVKVWQVRDGTCVDSFVAHEGRVNAVAVGEDDGGVFTAGTDGCVKVWRRVYGESTHALTMVLRFQSSPVNAVVIGASASYVYSGSSDGYVNIWEREAVTGRYHHGGFLQGHRYAVLCLAAVERVVLSGSVDTTIRVWRREEGSGFHVCLAVMEGHRGPVRCLAVGVEMEDKEGEMGLLVYSASLDRMLKAWRLKVAGDRETKEGKEEDSAAAIMPETDAEKSGVGEEYAMTPVLSPLWVETRMRQTDGLN